MSYDDKPTIDESLARAANSSNMRLVAERRGDPDLLIAAAKAPKVVGRHLIALHGEWDGCAKPRRPLQHDIERLAKDLPNPKEGDPPLVDAKARMERARTLASSWYETEKVRALMRLKSLDRVREGLGDAATLKGVENAHAKVLAVLAWWLDHTCPTCNGTKREMMPGTNRLSDRACRTCRGSGERPLPHGEDGRKIEALMIDFVQRARQNIAGLHWGHQAPGLQRE